jgi:hypothetical protein
MVHWTKVGRSTNYRHQQLHTYLMTSLLLILQPLLSSVLSWYWLIDTLFTTNKHVQNSGIYKYIEYFAYINSIYSILYWLGLFWNSLLIAGFIEMTPNPYQSNLSNNIQWSTMSKAFARSIYIYIYICILSK